MKLKLLTGVELEVITDVDGDDITSHNELFSQGTIIDVDICDAAEPPLSTEIQFGDGSVAFVTPNFWAVVERL